MHTKVTILFLCFVLMQGCNLPLANQLDSTTETLPGEISTESITSQIDAQASSTLRSFFAYLNQGDYEQAVRLYGGSYEELYYMNPTINPENKADLLESGCQFNGFMCMKVLNESLVEVKETREFMFEVNFANPDGSLYIMGPCCGASEEVSPPKSNFLIHVICETEDICRVLDLPPYVP
jgi:hypothetical protein